jgi:spermidine/putrescine transport system permease protein
MEIFSRIRTGVKPDINALSVILILVSAIVAFLAELIRASSEQESH